jgi:hypothetical protein
MDSLLAVVPALRPVYVARISDHDGLLPHAFFGDVTRFAVANAGVPAPTSDGLVPILSRSQARWNREWIAIPK